MKIGILLSDITKVGGIERVTSILVNEFERIPDAKIEIISLFKERESYTYPIPPVVPIHYLCNEPHGSEPHSFKRGLKMITLLSKIRYFLSRHDYDILMVQSFPPAFLAFFSGFEKKKIIAVEHVYAGYYGKISQKIRDHIYKKISKVVVLTSNDKFFFDKRISKEKVIVIPNPVQSSPSPKSNCESKRIIGIGRLVYQKGVDNLISGYKRICSRFPEWKLDIYGDGPLKEELTNLIRKEKLDNNVFLKGLTNNIPLELSKASIFVLPSRFEGFPMVLVEAMNQGVPCVSYNCPNGPADIVKTGVNGILVEDQNIDKFVEALEFLMTNDEIRKKYGKNAPESVSCFSKELIVKQWISLFKAIINCEET